MSAIITWDQLVELEPELGALEIEAERYRNSVPPDFCASAPWVGEHGIESRLRSLVGRDRPTPEPWPTDWPDVTGPSRVIVASRRSDKGPLWNFNSYRIAVQYLLDALPKCHNGCGCELSGSAAAAPVEMPAVEGWPEPLSLDWAGQLPPFPIDALPGWIGRFAGALAESTQTPLDMAAMLCLAVIAACAGGRVFVEVRPGYREPLNLYVAVALPPAERKSTTLRQVVAPLYEAEASLLEDARAGIVRARMQRKVAEQIAQTAEKEAARAKDPMEKMAAEERALEAAAEAEAIEVPAEPRLIAGDATPEKLEILLAEQRGKLGVFTAEGGPFNQMAGRYDSKKAGTGPNLDVWLQGHAGDTIRTDRVGRSAVFIEEACLTMGIAAQPEAIRTLAKVPGSRGLGLLARFLYVLPESRLGERTIDAPAIPATVREAYSSQVKALAITLHGQTTAAEVPFSAEAQSAWLEFAGALEPRMAPTGDLRHMLEWVGKLAGAVARVAGILHLATHGVAGTSVPVERGSVDSAVLIGRYLLAHAQAAHDLMGTDEKVDRARWLKDWLAERWSQPTVTRRQVMAAVARSRFPEARDVEEALELLAEYGWLQRHQAPVSAGRRVAGYVYELHPRLATCVDSVDCVAR